MDRWHLHSQAQVGAHTLHTLDMAREVHTAFVAGAGAEVVAVADDEDASAVVEAGNNETGCARTPETEAEAGVVETVLFLLSRHLHLHPHTDNPHTPTSASATKSFLPHRAYAHAHDEPDYGKGQHVLTPTYCRYCGYPH